MASQGATSRWQAPLRVLALLPLWLFLIVSAAQGPSVGGPFGKPPEFLGLPLGAWVAALVVGWTLAGLALIWNARSPLRSAAAILVFTIPATFVMFFGPAVILILQNLG